jgi:hypothetical protein
MIIIGPVLRKVPGGVNTGVVAERDMTTIEKEVRGTEDDRAIDIVTTQGDLMIDGTIQIVTTIVRTITINIIVIMMTTMITTATVTERVEEIGTMTTTEKWTVLNDALIS